MKRAKTLRTLEQLWDLEDRHPLVEPSGSGLLRWMAATGTLAMLPARKHAQSIRPANSSRRAKNGRS